MKYGVKLTIIEEMDYNELELIANAIRNLGFKITVVDNGNFVCELEKQTEVKKE